MRNQISLQRTMLKQIIKNNEKKISGKTVNEVKKDVEACGSKPNLKMLTIDRRIKIAGELAVRRDGPSGRITPLRKKNKK